MDFRKRNMNQIHLSQLLNGLFLWFICVLSHREILAQKNFKFRNTVVTYEVEVEQPYGLKFRKGRDGGTYIDAILPGGFADKTGKFTVGDRVIATSAVFGTEIWPAAEYGRIMYTIKQRIGPFLMKMEKRNGKVDDSGELIEKEIIRAWRNAGFISSRLREIQMQNYLRKKEQKAQRGKDLREGLQFSK